MQQTKGIFISSLKSCLYTKVVLLLCCTLMRDFVCLVGLHLCVQYVAVKLTIWMSIMSNGAWHDFPSFFPVTVGSIARSGENEYGRKWAQWWTQKLL